MAMGSGVEADVLLVHAPDSEKKFMAEGFGTEAVRNTTTSSSWDRQTIQPR